MRMTMMIHWYTIHSISFNECGLNTTLGSVWHIIKMHCTLCRNPLRQFYWSDQKDIILGGFQMTANTNSITGCEEETSHCELWLWQVLSVKTRLVSHLYCPSMSPPASNVFKPETRRQTRKTLSRLEKIFMTNAFLLNSSESVASLTSMTSCLSSVGLPAPAQCPVLSPAPAYLSSE